MSGDETYPATVGQLSVWRDIERFPPDGCGRPTSPSSGTSRRARWSEEQIWSALGAVAMRHASMRTTYVIDDEGFPRQRIAADTAAEVLAQVRQGTADVADREAKDAAEIRRGIDALTELPWRAWILLDGGRPAAGPARDQPHGRRRGRRARAPRGLRDHPRRHRPAARARAPSSSPSTSRARAAAGCATPNGTGGAPSAAAPRRHEPEDVSTLGAVLQTGIPMPLAHEADGQVRRHPGQPAPRRLLPRHPGGHRRARGPAVPDVGQPVRRAARPRP